MNSLKKINLNGAALYIGPLLFILILLLPTPEGMSSEAWKTIAVTVLIAVWWISEAIPIPATALLPIVLFPILGVAPINESAAPYSNPIIFLFLGGFIIAIALQTSNLHKRIALSIIHFVGTKPSSIILGFIIASAFLSMWVSNTATAVMMLPIAMSVINTASKEADQNTSLKNFKVALLLSIAYACNIGGIGTLIGTPPNALFAAYMLEQYNIEISLAKWMSIGVPTMIILLPIMYFIVTRIVYRIDLKELPGGKNLIEKQLKEIGKITKPEKRVAFVFVATALMWAFRPLLSGILPGLSDAGISIGAGVLLFTLPSGNNEKNRLLNWGDLKDLPWGILLLFGGGLSLAMAINNSGLATYIGSALEALSYVHVIVLMFMIVLIISFLTEVTSNTATISAFLPVLSSLAIITKQNPILFTLPAVLAVSCAFMLPVGTPPNAIVFSSGEINISEMSRAGIWLKLIFSFVITFTVYYVFTKILGVEIDVIPEWIHN